MDIKLKGVLTADRLKELLALIESGAGIAWYFDGRLQLRATVLQQAVAPRIDVSVSNRDDAHAQPELDVEIAGEEWDGPVPAYVGGVVDNSPEELERRRLLELNRRELDQRRAEADKLKKLQSDEHTMDKEVFGRLRISFGQPFIDAINTEIAAVWRDVTPAFSINCKDGKAGQPRLMPQLELRDETVWVRGFNPTGTMIKIATPVSISDSALGSRPLWKYKEWVEHAVPRIKAVIEDYALKANLVRVGIRHGIS